MSKFKTYRKAKDAACFNCGGSLKAETLCDDAFAAGNGQYSAVCEKCSMRTWFDIRPAQAAKIAA